MLTILWIVYYLTLSALTAGFSVVLFLMVTMRRYDELDPHEQEIDDYIRAKGSVYLEERDYARNPNT